MSGTASKIRMSPRTSSAAGMTWTHSASKAQKTQLLGRERRSRRFRRGPVPDDLAKAAILDFILVVGRLVFLVEFRFDDFGDKRSSSQLSLDGRTLPGQWGLRPKEYEFIIVRVAPAATAPSGAVVPRREAYPSSDRWGSSAGRFQSAI
jgi:hypothetical protein